MKIALGTAEGEVYLFLDEQGRDKLIENLKRLEFPKDLNHTNISIYFPRNGERTISRY